MFRNNWLTIVFLILVAGLVLNQRGLLTLAILVTTVMGVATLWDRFALRGLHYRRIFEEERAFVGETIGMTLELENKKPLPLSWVKVEDRFPEGMAPVGRQLLPSGVPGYELLTNVGALGWFEKVRWYYEFPCTQRGFYFFGHATVMSGDIFGIFERETILEGKTRLIVYPQVESLTKLGLPAKNPFGGKRTHLPVFEDPTRVIGVRDYHPDDPMRRVHWKATARLQKPQIRVWEPTQEQQTIVFLNVTSFEKHWQGVNRELLEWTISVAASICQHAFEERNAVGLVANASIPQSDQPVKVPLGRSPHQMRYILEALAAVTFFATSTIDGLLRTESPKLGWGATLVVVTAVVTDALLAQMVRLHRAGRPMVLVSLDNSFEEVAAQRLRAQGIITYRLPHAFTVKPAADLSPPALNGHTAEVPTPTKADPNAIFRRPATEAHP